MQGRLCENTKRRNSFHIKICRVVAEETIMAAGLVSRFNVFLSRAKAFAKDRRSRMAVLREVDALSVDERVRLLEESGVSYREFATSMRTPFIADDLNARALQAIGADPVEFRSRHIEWSRHMQRRTGRQRSTRCGDLRQRRLRRTRCGACDAGLPHTGRH